MNEILRQPPDIENTLAFFLTRHASSPVDRLTGAIAEHCRRGFGTWMAPNPVNAAPYPRPATGRALGAENAPLEPFPGAPRPATHLFEICLFGITAIGFTATEAAANWRTVATRIADSDLPDGEITF